MPLPIETERLRIREPREEDVDAFFAIWSDPEVTRYLAGDPPETRQDALSSMLRRHMWQEHLGYTMWTVELRTTEKIIGACGYFPLEGTGPEVELAYHFARDHWGRGYASEAAAACLAFGLEKLGFDRVLAITFQENKASRRVLEKIGMRYAGIQRFYDTDAAVYEAVPNPQT